MRWATWPEPDRSSDHALRRRQTRARSVPRKHHSAERLRSIRREGHEPVSGPEPSRPGADFRRLIPTNTNNNKFDIRIDERASDKDQLFGRVSWDHQESTNARAFPAAGTGGSNGNFNRYLTGAIGWTRTVTPTTINDFRFSAFRGVQQRLLNQGAGDVLGIPNLNLVGIPNFTVPGYAGLGDAQAFNPVENQFQLQDTVTFVRGRHIIKAGVDFAACGKRPPASVHR